MDEAVERARSTVHEKNPDLDDGVLHRSAREVGIGAVKYADLATSRTRDYIFDLNRMVSLQGNTGVYLQYDHARIRSILCKLPQDRTTAEINVDVALDPAERTLALLLDEFAATVAAVVDNLEPTVQLPLRPRPGVHRLLRSLPRHQSSHPRYQKQPPGAVPTHR